MKARYIPHNELRNVWQWVKIGLEKVIYKAKTDWIVEDIYTSCFNQHSMLWIVSNDDVDCGFMVLQPSENRLHVWAAYLDSANPNDVIDGFNHIKEIAKTGGAKKVTFSSMRKGWERHARKIGCTPSTWECIL